MWDAGQDDARELAVLCDTGALEAGATINYRDRLETQVL